MRNFVALAAAGVLGLALFTNQSSTQNPMPQRKYEKISSGSAHLGDPQVVQQPAVIRTFLTWDEASRTYPGPKDAMDPQPKDLLQTSPKLSKCPGFQIIEWKASKGHQDTTGISEQNLEIINDVCDKSLTHFESFIAKTGQKLKHHSPFWINVSILPGNMARDGLYYGNLNDDVYRFKNRVKNYNSEGRLFSINGYTHYKSKIIFVMNDVMLSDGTPNSKFKEVLSHELFHAMSDHFGVRAQHSDSEEERLAREYSKFVGY